MMDKWTHDPISAGLRAAQIPNIVFMHMYNVFMARLTATSVFLHWVDLRQPSTGTEIRSPNTWIDPAPFTACMDA
jgi:hypothetical protein